MLRALLDANALYGAPVRDILLRTAEARLFEPLWSEEILREVERNLLSRLQRLRSPGDARMRWQRLRQALDAAFPAALVTGYESLIPDMTNHPKDRHVLAAAVASKADVLVTENLRDFPPSTARGVLIQSPDDFLLALFADHATTMLHILTAQGSELRHTRTLAGTLAVLERRLPRFVASVRAAIAE